MPFMGKKRGGKQQGANGPAPRGGGDLHKGIQAPFRVPDPRLLGAVQAYADRHRRSRNMAIILLLEKALRDEGLWPPPAPKDG